MDRDLREAFKAAMRQIASSVAIITTSDESGWHGIAATSVVSLSVAPPTVLVCVNREASIHQVLLERSKFCLSFLANSHSELCEIFGGRGDRNKRFKTGEWSVGDEALPYLTDAQANLFCHTTLSLQYQTHTIFIGSVRSVRSHAGFVPLIYHDGRCMSIATL
jgi:flavin reductase (DIM6/NTAB) family NADH-FMN oxidoreductase RutF